MVSRKTGRILDNLMGAIRGGGDPAHIAASFYTLRMEIEATGGNPKAFTEALRLRFAGLNDLSAYARGASEWPGRRAELLAEWKQGDADSQALAMMLEKYTAVPTAEEIAEADETMLGTWRAAPMAKPADWLERIIRARFMLAKDPTKS